ncbi:hypothetical protein Lfu02_05840 [Longispora fulva]|uniref:HEAT repeat protein n=1 Tax=Longispora fulva TaxID=619741 RepID=A0A8J7GBP9_9ACTN|nr:hypothetical protein [Longispora fulva]MBG6135549.1 HEAT repeat protein [Longispora fulva]GIG56212.1 hypothetical protein Lfu02_05840 [Longispora fulva]
MPRPAGPADFLWDAADDPDPEVRRAAVDAFAAGGASWWLAIDEALRARWAYLTPWEQPLPDQVIAADADLLHLAMAGCHRDGRLRAAAVIRLADHPHPAATAVLAIRTGDWARQVREQARRILGSRLARPGADTLVTAAVLGFAIRNRHHGAWLPGLIEHHLSHLPVADIEPLLTAGDRWTRRAAFRAATARGLLDRQRLIAAAVSDQDLPIRTLCARAAIGVSPDPAAVRGLLASRTALVRAEALHHLAVHGEDRHAAVSALGDRHPLVRATAQAALRGTPHDLAGHYRAMLAEDPPKPGAIAGLGETGTPADGALLIPWLAHPSSRGRVEAIRALRRLGALDPVDLVPMLHDVSGVVSRQAAAVLRHHTALVEESTITALLVPGGPRHQTVAGYRLLRAGDVWRRLAVGLRLVAGSDDHLRALARADIATCLSGEAATTYAVPAPDLAAELDTLVRQVATALDPSWVRQLRFHAGLDRPRRTGTQ